MDKPNIIIIADTFQLIHKGFWQLLKKANDMLNKNLNIDYCFICIAPETGDILGFYEKESMLKKLTGNNNKFQFFHIETLKMVKDIKHFQEDYNIICILTDFKEKSFMENNLKGLNIPIYQYIHDVTIEEVENSILNDDYATYTRLVPQTLWDEFQNLKELYTMTKFSENKQEDAMVPKMSRNELELLVQEVINETFTESKKNKTITISKQKLKEMIRGIVLEKLVGQEFNDMYDLKLDILNQIKKISKTKWLRLVSNVGKKSDGNYIVKLVGSGGVKINLIWGSSLEDGDFIISTGATLVAGEEFSTEAYKFMIQLVDKKDAILKFLNSVESQINDLEPEEESDDMPETPEESDDMPEMPEESDDMPEMPEESDDMPEMPEMPEPEGMEEEIKDEE